MWHFEGSDGARPITEPELICAEPVGAGVTDLCFLDERSLIAGLENGGVVLLQYWTSSKVTLRACMQVQLGTYPQIFSPLPTCLMTLYLTHFHV